MNIFMREMKAHRKSLILWCIGMLFMIIAGMGKYSYYYESGEDITKIIGQIPKTLRSVLGFGDFDVTKASGFYGVLFVYLIVMVTIHAVMLGANIISKEERDKTAEFLMVKPVSRTKIVSAKLLAGLANVVILNLVTLVFSLSIVGKYAHGEQITGKVLILMAGMFILQVLFLLIGSGIASVIKNPKSAGSLATTVLLVTFIISVITDMKTELEVLKYLTPFKYFEASSLMYGGGMDPVFVSLSVLLIAAASWVTFSFYKKKDLNI